MSYVAAGVMGGSALLSYMGNQQAAGAAGSAAQAQQAQAAANQQQIMGLGNQAQRYAQATPQELNMLGQSYGAASQNLQQQQNLMASVDPGLMQASQQALSILNGGTAAVNQPMMNLRNQQRAQLVNSLNAQYGPGAENSSVGQKALQQFDLQTQNSFQQNQMASMGQLSGMANQGAMAMGSSNNQALGGMQNVFGQANQIQMQQSNAALGTANALGGVNNQMYQSAGGQFAAQGLQGQFQQGMFGSIMGGAGAALGQQMYGGGGSGFTVNNYGGGGGGGGLTQPSLGSSFGY